MGHTVNYNKIYLISTFTYNMFVHFQLSLGVWRVWIFFIILVLLLKMVLTITLHHINPLQPQQEWNSFKCLMVVKIMQRHKARKEWHQVSAPFLISNMAINTCILSCRYRDSLDRNPSQRFRITFVWWAAELLKTSYSHLTQISHTH